MESAFVSSVQTPFHGRTVHSTSSVSTRRPQKMLSAGPSFATRRKVTARQSSPQQNTDADKDINNVHTELFEESPFIVDVDGDSELDGDDDQVFDDELDLVDVDAPQRRKRERRRTSDLISQIDTEPLPNEAFASDADNQPPIERDEAIPFIETVVKAADTRKAEDIVAIRVSKITYMTSFVIAATGNNAPQLRAIANLVEEDLTTQHGLEPRRVDGVPASGWILLDYGDFLVNIFSREQRQNYNLEALWRRGEVLDVSKWVITGDEPTQPEVQPKESLDDWLGE